MPRPLPPVMTPSEKPGEASTAISPSPVGRSLSHLLIQRCTHPAMATGGAAIVASAILFLTTPGEREQAMARITPSIHDRSTGLAIIGRF